MFYFFEKYFGEIEKLYFAREIFWGIEKLTLDEKYFWEIEKLYFAREIFWEIEKKYIFIV